MCFFSRFRQGPEEPIHSRPPTPEPGIEYTIIQLENVAERAGIKMKNGKKKFSQREIQKLDKVLIQMKEKLERMDQAESKQLKVAAMYKRESVRECQEKELREYTELEERMKRINEDGRSGN